MHKPIRDYLYTRMRGARDHGHPVPHAQAGPVPAEAADELTAVLREVAVDSCASCASSSGTVTRGMAMLERTKALMLQALAVPPEPTLPAGSAGSACVFRASRRYLQLKLLSWGAAQAATLTGMIFALAVFDLAAFGAERAVRQLPFRALAPIALTLFAWIEAFGLIAFVVLHTL